MSMAPTSSKHTLRIAIIATTAEYRHAVALARILQKDIQQNELSIELVFAYFGQFTATDAMRMPEGMQSLDQIKTRSYQWLPLDKHAAYRAMIYAGFKNFVPQFESYQVPDDDVQQFTDCDMWIFDAHPVKHKHALLPIRPYIILTDSTLPDNLNPLSFLPMPLATSILHYGAQTRPPL